MKKQTTLIAKILSMLLIFSFLVSFGVKSYAAEAENNQSFHAPTLLKMIKTNLMVGSTDEEFFHRLADAYLSNPSFFAITVSNLEPNEIEYIAKAVAYDLIKTNRTNLAVMPARSTLPVVANIVRLICEEADNSDNSSIESFEGILQVETPCTITSADVPLSGGTSMSRSTGVYVTSASLAASKADIFNIVNYSVTFYTTSASSNDRQFRVELHKVVDSEDYVMISKNVTLPAASHAVSVTIPAVFNTTGQQSVYAKIYSGTTTVATSPSSEITIKGQWHIDVALPTDRDYLGTIYLYDAAGNLLLSDICLGKSGTGWDIYTEYGHTPPGEYTGELLDYWGAESSYGPYMVIETTPVSGIVYDYNRHSIWIHGGDEGTDVTSPAYPLRETQGCVRVKNDTQLSLQNFITDLIESACHYSEGTVSMFEVD